ncbi:hypothetical protein Acr_00g0100630 [Actinidia rufa]|uniref:Uncharacterized protein n=1 Tax=Actinidia rufa TaxID=165716 RepID=A0A7J0E032_9ERIC|nr:hypothetical protein Acr_00g0100630 [Actinidia rufa]
MSVAELKERHIEATNSVNALRERVKEKCLLLLDTDVEGYARSQGKATVYFGPTNLVCCRTLQGHTGTVRAKTTITFELLLFSKFGGVTVPKFGRGQRMAMIPKDARGQKSSPKSMAGSSAYSLTQQSAHPSARRAAICPMTRQLASQGMRRTVQYKVSIYFSKRWSMEFVFPSYTLSWDSSLNLEETLTLITLSMTGGSVCLIKASTMIGACAPMLMASIRASRGLLVLGLGNKRLRRCIESLELSFPQTTPNCCGRNLGTNNQQSILLLISVSTSGVRVVICAREQTLLAGARPLQTPPAWRSDQGEQAKQRIIYQSSQSENASDSYLSSGGKRPFIDGGGRVV